ncbi:hypothetical protein [Tahibacter harae]|uniref:Carboxypeptidase regulatory-like domain-containing protein n=1 Tax=Tahibacter harae TaxID=2963937 RepID=A0ABT1QSA2_9GAMM|nr:hypothetical protein [Tahibacter harae]MCQ4165146.1 hypothetical protein [Tahibacter harae]
MARVLTTFAAAHGNFSGPGYIAGVPPGLVTVNGAAAAREVELRHRDSRAVVAATRSASDGTYLFRGLRTGEQYDLIGRDYGNVYNDVIVSRVTPVPYAITLTGALTADDPTNTLAGSIAVAGGLHPLAVSVAAGAAPPGITFSISSRALVAAGSTTAGSYSWTLRVTGATGHAADIACAATFT